MCSPKHLRPPYHRTGNCRKGLHGGKICFIFYLIGIRLGWATFALIFQMKLNFQWKWKWIVIQICSEKVLLRYISDYVILQQYIYNIKVAGHSRRFEPCFVCAVKYWIMVQIMGYYFHFSSFLGEKTFQINLKLQD